MALRALQGPTGGGAPVGGTGTTNTIPRWTGASTLGDSGLIDNGTAIYTTTRSVGIGAATAPAKLSVIGNLIAHTTAGAYTNYGWQASFYDAAQSKGVAICYNTSPNGNLIQGLGAAGSNSDLNLNVYGGNVGIGTASPTQKLDVNGSIRAVGNVDATGYSVYAALVGAATVQTTSTLTLNTTAASSQIVFQTNNAERARIDSSGRLLVGTSTAASSTDVRQIVAKTGDVYTQYANTTTNGGTVVGSLGSGFGIYTYTGGIGSESYVERLRVSPSGTQAQSQVAIGTSSFTSGRALTTVADLDIFGVRVGRGGDASQTSSVAVGPGALGATSTGSQNTAVGYTALSGGTGASNTAIGSGALRDAFSGNNNTAIGVAAILPVSSTASGNTAVGMEALRSHTSGNSNTAIGWRAGYGAASANANTTGSDNIYVGRETVGTANNNTNEIVIGAGATGNGSNTVTIGNSSNVGTFLDTKYVRIVDSYTVATLPAAGTAGRIARVTDGDAGLAWGATVVNTGAGATPYLVWDNGTNWTVFGK